VTSTTVCTSADETGSFAVSTCLDLGTSSVNGTNYSNDKGIIDLTSLQDDLWECTKNYNNFWIKIGRVTLYQNDRCIILNGDCLWGTHLTAIQTLKSALSYHQWVGRHIEGYTER